RLFVWLVFPTFVLLYSFYAFFLAHYPITAAPAILLNVLAGAHVVSRTWPRAYPILRTFLTASLVMLSITELPECNRVIRDEMFDAPHLAQIDEAIAQLPHKPAIVLFRFAPSVTSEEEPVYNTDVINPDDAIVIRAHDLGARNIELFNYYSTRAPN